MYAYKTIFVPAEIIKSALNMKFQPNGDQLARDVEAALIEMHHKGYELVSSNMLNSNHQSAYSHTSGMMLIFKKIT